MTQESWPVATNALSLLHGASPMDTFPLEHPLQRIFLVYLRIGESGIFARQFYYDFRESWPEVEDELRFNAANTDVERLIGQVVEKVRNDGPNLKYDPKNPAPFPQVFRPGANHVDFGWKPCHVVYILDNEHYEFQMRNSGDILNQPVVFRSSKAVREGAFFTIKRYQENRSFFNMTTFDYGAYSVIRFDNVMCYELNGHIRSIGDPPVRTEDQAAYRYDYCMDIHIESTQMRKMALDEELTPNKAIQNNEGLADVTIVFDPPQSNGGGEGPP